MKSLNDWILLGQQHPRLPTPLMPTGPSGSGPATRARPWWNHYSDPSQQFHAGFWPASRPLAVHYTEHEYCQLLEGRRGSTTVRGQLHLAGRSPVIPAGFVGEWETLRLRRKLYGDLSNPPRPDAHVNNRALFRRPGSDHPGTALTLTGMIFCGFPACKRVFPLGTVIGEECNGISSPNVGLI